MTIKMFDPVAFTNANRKLRDIVVEVNPEYQTRMDVALLEVCRMLEIHPADVADRLFAKVRGRDSEIPDSLGGTLLAAVPWVSDQLDAEERERCAPVPVIVNGEPWETDGLGVVFRPGIFYPYRWTADARSLSGTDVSRTVSGQFEHLLTPIDTPPEYTHRDDHWFVRASGERTSLSSLYSTLFVGAVLEQRGNERDMVRVTRDGVVTAYMMPTFVEPPSPKDKPTLILGPLSRAEADWLWKAARVNKRWLSSQPLDKDSDSSTIE
jgi:hypothetical protein